MEIPNVPKWKIVLPVTDYGLASRLKRITSTIVYLQLFADLVRRKYRKTVQLYTDWSKTEAGVGAATMCLYVTHLFAPYC